MDPEIVEMVQFLDPEIVEKVDKSYIWRIKVYVWLKTIPACFPFYSPFVTDYCQLLCDIVQYNSVVCISVSMS